MALEISPLAILSNEDARRQAKLIKALADPTRLQILHILKQHRAAIAVEKIVERFDLQQPTISHHLRILLDVGLVNYKKSGLRIYYFIEDPKLIEAFLIIRRLLSQKGQ